MGRIALKCEQCGGNIELEEDGAGKCPYCGCEYIDSRPITNNYYINYGADTANQLASTAEKYLKSNNSYLQISFKALIAESISSSVFS